MKSEMTIYPCRSCKSIRKRAADIYVVTAQKPKSDSLFMQKILARRTLVVKHHHKVQGTQHVENKNVETFKQKLGFKKEDLKR